MWWTETYRNVVDDFALGVDATSTSARVYAFVVDTGFDERAVGIENTFRSTGYPRIAKESFSAGTAQACVLFDAVGV